MVLLMRRICFSITVPLSTTIVFLALGACVAGQETALQCTRSPKEEIHANGTEVNWLYGAYLIREVALRPLTNHQRGQLYLRQTFLPWGIYLKTGIFSLGDQAKGPPASGRGASAGTESGLPHGTASSLFKIP